MQGQAIQLPLSPGDLVPTDIMTFNFSAYLFIIKFIVWPSAVPGWSGKLNDHQQDLLFSSSFLSKLAKILSSLVWFSLVESLRIQNSFNGNSTGICETVEISNFPVLCQPKRGVEGGGGNEMNLCTELSYSCSCSTDRVVWRFCLTMLVGWRCGAPKAQNLFAVSDKKKNK